MQVLVFGEDDNDVRAISEIIKPIAPGNLIVRPVKAPAVFAAKDSSRKVLDANRDKISDAVALWEMKKRKKVRAVVIHRDCDSCEPTHVAESKRIEEEFSKRVNVKVVAATPAWELESWLMLFPEALKEYRACWKSLNLGSKSVGAISNSKEFLTKSLRAKGCPDYRESDSPGVAKKIANYSGMYKARGVTCASFAEFIKNISRL